MGVGGRGPQRTLALPWLPALGMPKKKEQSGSGRQLPEVPRGSAGCGGPKDWSHTLIQKCTSLSKGSQHPVPAEAGSPEQLNRDPHPACHCQTFFLEVRHPSQGPAAGNTATLPQRAWPRKEFKAGSGDPAASAEAAPARAGSGCVPSPLPPTMSRIPSPTQFALWAAASGRPLGYRTGESRPLCAIRGLSCGSLPRAQDGRGSGRVSQPVCAPPRVLLQGLRGPRGHRSTWPVPLQGLSCAKDLARPPARQGPPPEASS